MTSFCMRLAHHPLLFSITFQCWKKSKQPDCFFALSLFVAESHHPHSKEGLRRSFPLQPPTSAGQAELRLFPISQHQLLWPPHTCQPARQGARGHQVACQTSPRTSNAIDNPVIKSIMDNYQQLSLFPASCHVGESLLPLLLGNCCGIGFLRPFLPAQMNAFEYTRQAPTSISSHEHRPRTWGALRMLCLDRNDHFLSTGAMR